MNGRHSERRPVIALLTDFGTEDPFVGVMKGVILSRGPTVSIVDLTHAVPPQSVSEGAFWLDRCFRWFPEGTIFVAVVDPGVGTHRRAVVVEAHRRLFLGPDNGLLATAVLSDSGWRAHEIDAAKSGLPEPSRTFHGRDVFAPIAAEIAEGRRAPHDVGPRATDLAPLAATPIVVRPGRVEGTIVTVDRFGNLITDITAESIAKIDRPVIEVSAHEFPMAGTYGDVAVGAHVGVVNAFGTVELAERDGSATRSLGLGRGARVVVRTRN